MDREPCIASIARNSCFCLQTQNTGVSSVFSRSILNRNRKRKPSAIRRTQTGQGHHSFDCPSCIVGAVAVCNDARKKHRHALRA